jgi:hypothetical protein
MDGPSDEIRRGMLGSIASVADAPDEEAELRLEATLNDIGGLLERDVATADSDALDDESAMDQLAAIDAWAGLISSAVARVYAPASPWRRGVAGWAKRVAARLRWLTNLLLVPLKAVAAALGASSYSIGVSFPWGVSVGLNWP